MRRNVPSTDVTWKSYFTVRPKAGERVDIYAYAIESPTYEVVNVVNGEVVGTYRTASYAVKQARRKYKKLVRLMEKNFMSLA